MWQVVCGFQTEILKITNQEDLARDGNMKRRAEWNRTSERVCSPACLRATGLSSDHRVALEQGSHSLCFPIVNADAIEAPLFRVLVQRRLRLNFLCGCGAACSRTGVLGRRGFALESALARDCREAGGRVATNLFVCNDSWRSLLMASPLRRGAVGCRHHARLRFEREWRTSVQTWRWPWQRRVASQRERAQNCLIRPQGTSCGVCS